MATGILIRNYTSENEQALSHIINNDRTLHPVVVLFGHTFYFVVKSVVSL